jgi:hypothetical protein
VAIQGSVEEAGLPDVLQLLALGRKTGCLVVIDAAMQGQIFLDVGRVSYATVSNRPDRLGDMLVKSGRITRQQLDHAIAEQTRTSGHQIGRILVDAGSIERAELERFIRLQVEEAVYFLFTWKQGTFSFTSDRLPPHQSLLVPLDTEALLLEGARRVDEWSLIQKKIPSFDLVYRRTRETLGPAGGGLTDEQKRILPLLDGTRDVNGVVEATGMAEFDVGKAIYGLVTAGFAQLVERRARVRHLEYRELLAYAVREAEYADPQRRKEAARHIVDCPICAEHLRTMHVRTTTGAVPVAVAEAQLDLAEDLEAKALQSPHPTAAASRSAAAVAAMVERRLRERRTGSDRRQRERRTGVDRRRAVNAARPQAAAERRVGPRREEDRRTGDSRPRRTAERIQRSASAVSQTAVAVEESVSGAADSVSPEPAAASGEQWPHSDGQPVEIVTGAEPEPAVAEGGAPSAGSDLAAPAPSPPAPSPEPVAPAGGGAPEGEQPGARSGLAWVVTPEESLEMIRSTRAVRGGDATKRAPQKAAPQAGARTANHVRAPGPSAILGTGPGAGAGAADGSGAEALDRYLAGPARAANGEVRRRAGQDAGRQAFPVKRLAIAAGIVGVAVLGYMAGQLGGRRAAGGAAAATAAGAGARAAAAPEQPSAPSPEAGSPARGEVAAAGSTTEGAAPRQAATSGEATTPRTAPPAAEPSVRSRERPRPEAAVPVAAAPKPAAAQPAAPVAEAAAPQPAPTVGVIRGVVRDAGGRVLPGAHLSVRGTALSAVTDGSGAFEIRDVPGGPATVLASADGFVAGSADVRVQAGAETSANLALSRPVAAAEPDEELAAGGWAPVDRAEAASILGGTLGAIEGLPIESISKSTAAGRARVRVAQLTQAGQRIVLTETRAGAAVRAAGPVVVTALRVIPPSDAYPWSTASASFGNVLINVKTKLAVESLRSMLGRLGEVPPSE